MTRLGNRPARVWWTKMSRFRCEPLEGGMQLTATTDSRLAQIAGVTGFSPGPIYVSSSSSHISDFLRTSISFAMKSLIRPLETLQDKVGVSVFVNLILNVY